MINRNLHQIQASACAFLLLLSSQPRLLDRMKTAGGVERIQSLMDPTDLISNTPWRPLMGNDTKRAAQELLGKLRGPSSPTSPISPSRRLSTSSNEGSPLLPAGSRARHFGETNSKGSGSHNSFDNAVAATGSTSGQSGVNTTDRIGRTLTGTGARALQYFSAVGKNLQPSWLS